MFILKDESIIYQGLTKTDISILRALASTEKGLGYSTLSAKCGISRDDYMIVYEPYLLEQGFLDISSRRFITDTGKELLTKI